MITQKIEVGQVLSHPHNKFKYKITKVVFDSNSKPFCRARGFVRPDALDNEIYFGTLTMEWVPDGWDQGWEIETNIPETTSLPNDSTVNIVEDDHTKMMQFFRASLHPENCQKCGAPKPCSYHPS